MRGDPRSVHARKAKRNKQPAGDRRRHGRRARIEGIVALEQRHLRRDAQTFGMRTRYGHE